MTLTSSHVWTGFRYSARLLAATRWLALGLLACGCGGSHEPSAPAAPAPEPTKSAVEAKAPVDAIAAEAAPAPGRPGPVPERRAALAAATVERANDFALKMLWGLEPQRDNLVIAPLTALVALEMVLPGARGKSADELRKALQIDTDQALALTETLRALTEQPGPHNELSLAQGLYVQRDLVIEPDYQTALTSDFHASFAALDFQHDTEAARARINADISTATRDKISELLPAGTLSANTALVLTSALAMLGQWDKPFDVVSTQAGSFKPLNKPAIQVPFMQRTGQYALGELANATVLELPYQGDALSMQIVLPKTEPRSLSKLTAAALRDATSSLRPRSVHLRLPRFSAKLPSASLVPVLQKLGVRLLFGDKADLSGIAGTPGDLRIGAVRHGAFVTVDEHGTEAAGATAVEVTYRSRPQSVSIDRPFVFLIRARESGLLLFLGRISDPSRPAG